MYWKFKIFSTIDDPKNYPTCAHDNILIICHFPQGVSNFVHYKFGHLVHKDWMTMYDLAKMFLHCMNHWKLETPTARKQRAQADEAGTYKVSYTR